MDLTYQFLKKRTTFGAQPLFCEQGPELCDSIVPEKSEQKKFILRNPVHELIQNTPVYSQHDINTYRAKYTTTGINHSEGGWAKDIPLHDIEATQRYKRKIEKEDGYIHCVMALYPGLDHYIDQNNAIDMYQSYFTELVPQPDVEKNGCRTVNIFKDNADPPRSVTSINWIPEGGNKFAVSYLDLDMFYNPIASTECYIWNVENCNEIDQILYPPKGVIELQYNHRDTNVLVGALVSGTVGIWDTRTGGTVTMQSLPHISHRDIVRSVRFVHSKSGTEFFSGSSDGTCKWWDYRKFSEPIDTIIIDIVKAATDIQSMATALPISVLEYEPSIPTRFMVGTDNGLVVSGNKKGKTPFEMLPANFDAHLGAVWSLERNPSFLKNFLTVGDWTAKIFSEDCKESPVYWTPPQRHKITAGTWSPTRCSLMLLSHWNGVLALWDLLRHQHAPVLAVQLCEEPILKLAMNDNALHCACGTKKGNTYLAELSQSLASSGKNDKQMMGLVLERESKRERILEARLREIRLKQRQAEEGSPQGSATDIDPTIGDKDLHEATTEYMQVAKKEWALMG